jgi:hypothetical protein
MRRDERGRVELDHSEIDRPDYCECETPWQTRTGPLKDGSHYHNCVAAEVAEKMAELRRDADALRKARDLASRYTSERYPDTGAKLHDLQALFDVLGVD